MAPLTGTFSLLSLGDLVPAIQDTPLGDASLDLKVASGQIQVAAPVGGVLPVDLSFQVGGTVSVVALNGASGIDEAGVVAAGDAQTPAGAFAPPLVFDGTHGWLKYVANAFVKADAAASAGLVSFTGRAGEQIEMADYHRHALTDRLLGAIPADLKALRSALVLNHVQHLPEGDALTFQTIGELSASLEIEWSDVFTSEISALARLLQVAAPIAIKTTAGATCSVNVAVTDSFLVAFARATGGGLTVTISKGRVTKIDGSAGARISASLEDSNAIETVLSDVVAGLLGTAADRLHALLDRLASGVADPGDQTLAARIVDRLKLAGIGQIEAAVADLTAKARSSIEAAVSAKVEASFAYEYHRVGSDVSVFSAEIPEGGPGRALHAELVEGNLAAAFSRTPTDLTVRKFLNERSTRVTQAWGFTLGLNKWKVFGQDRRRAEAVERVDLLAGTIQRTYVGSGGYSRNKLSWTVDLAADMAAGSRAPTVGDYRFGLHLAMLRDRQTFTEEDLDAVLDFAALWSICPEGSRPSMREQLVSAVTEEAEWSFHLRVKDEALRPMFRVLGSMVPRDFAGAAAAALDPAGIPSVAERRRVYEPLWQAVLESPDAFTIDTVRSAAGTLLKDAGLARRERTAIEHGFFDQSTVATVVAFDPDWWLDCRQFSNGCRRLADALAVPTPDAGCIPDAYAQLVHFWTQSHYVRTLGAVLVDAAQRVGHFQGVDRTLNFKTGETTTVVSSNVVQAEG